jgi:hypothetical protein
MLTIPMQMEAAIMGRTVVVYMLLNEPRIDTNR